MTCTHCNAQPLADHAGVEHPNLCCDCFDLSWGMPVEQVNAERAMKGHPPVEPWAAMAPDPGFECLVTMLYVGARVVHGTDLTPDLKANVMEHLAACPRCRHLAAKLVTEDR